MQPERGDLYGRTLFGLGWTKCSGKRVKSHANWQLVAAAAFLQQIVPHPPPAPRPGYIYCIDTLTDGTRVLPPVLVILIYHYPGSFTPAILVIHRGDY